MTKLAEKTVTIVLVHVVALLTAIAFLVSPNSIQSPKYVDVRFGGLVDVRTFVRPMQVSELTVGEGKTPTIKQIYDLVEAKGYHYTPDTFSLVAYQGTITNSLDFWLFSSEALQLWRIDGHSFYGDCEDGAIFLCSLLRGYGYDARVYVGTVVIDCETYGHAWVEVKTGEGWMLLESTRGEALGEMDARPYFYQAAYSFTDSNVKYYMVSGVSESFPPIPPSRIERFRNLLRGW